MAFLRPNADDIDGNWLNAAGNNTDLYASLDETVAGDTDYIVSPANPVNEVCRIALSNPPGTVGAPFILRYRFNNISGTTLRVRLMQDVSTEIAVWSETGSGWMTSEQTLTALQISLITDFNDLFVEFTANPTAAGDPTLVLDIDFVTGVLDSKITFTRSTTATYVNSSGVVTVAAVDAPRFDYDSTTLTAKGLLFEEQQTNLCLQSGKIATSPWGTYQDGSGTVSVTADAATAPDGTMTAVLISAQRGAVTQYAMANQMIAAAAADYTISVWLKAKAAGDVGRQVGVGLCSPSAWVKVKACTLTADWVRYSLTDNLQLAQIAVGLIYSPSGDYVEAGILVDFYAWGVDIKAASFLTSYVPTTTAAVTRAADSAIITGTNFSSWWNASAGTFVASFDGPVNGTRPIIAVDDNTADEVIMLYGSGVDPKATVTDGGATQADLDAGTLVANTVAKLGFSFAANDFAACLNGGTVATDTGGTLPTVTQARIGAGPAGNYLNGHVTSVKFYNVAKSDAELQTLTT